MSEYCAYTHFSAMLERTGENWWIAMIDLRPDDYEVYFDDSGTGEDSPVAVAACYIASKLQWDEFTRNWNDAKQACGFDFFHMTDFMVNPKSVNWDQTSKQSPVLRYKDWSQAKRCWVYERLVNLIQTRVRHGFSVTVGKQDYDDFMPEDIERLSNRDHYGFAVKILIGDLAKWRKRWGVNRPMQYVFSNIPKGKGTRGEILNIVDSLRDEPDGDQFGILKDGFGCQDMRAFPPLQAADILAWNILDHHLNVIIPKRPDIFTSKWFWPLRLGQPLDASFVTREQMERFGNGMRDEKEQTGHYPSRRIERLLQKEFRRSMNAKRKVPENPF